MIRKPTYRFALSLRAVLIAAAIMPVGVWYLWSRYAPYPNIGTSRFVFDGGEASAQVSCVYGQVGLRRALRYLVIRASDDETHMTSSLGFGERPVSDRGISIADSAIFVDGQEYLPKIKSGYLVWDPLAKRFEEVPDDLMHASFKGQQDVLNRETCRKEVAPLVKRIQDDLEALRRERFRSPGNTQPSGKPMPG